MDLFSNLYLDVKLVKIKKRSGKIVSGYVVGNERDEWAGAWFSTESKAWAFSDFIKRRKDETIK